MKYKNKGGGKRRIVPTLLVLFIVLLYPLFPGILVSLGYGSCPHFIDPEEKM